MHSNDFGCYHFGDISFLNHFLCFVLKKYKENLFGVWLQHTQVWHSTEIVFQVVTFFFQRRKIVGDIEIEQYV